MLNFYILGILKGSNIIYWKDDYELPLNQNAESSTIVFFFFANVQVNQPNLQLLEYSSQ